MSIKAYVSNVSYYAYSDTSSGTGSVYIKQGTTEIKHDLDEEAIHDIRVVVDRLAQRMKFELSKQIAQLEVLPQLSYQDRAQAIDGEYTSTASPAQPVINDETPF